MSAMLTPRDVAAAWQCSTGHVRKLCRTGALQAMRLGSDWRISPEAIAEFAAGHANAAPAHSGRAVDVRPVLTAMPDLPADYVPCFPELWNRS